MNWWKDLKGKVRQQELLKNHTTFKIGGPAKFFIEPKDTRDLKLLLNLKKRYKISILIIGAGSNILANDKGADAVVLHLNSPYFKRISFRNSRLEVGSGVMLKRIVLLAQKYGLSGLEFLAGIPGTVGGALAMNAGAAGDNIARLVEKVVVMDYNGKIKALDKKKIRFGYRRSNLSRYIILSAHLKLFKKDKGEIKDRMNRYLNYRITTQDLSKASAGCIFKNPSGYSAGKLIELSSLKGKRIGDACISRKHANFILNQGRARAADVLKLMHLITKEVKSKFNITLEPEIKIWK